jgi:hypothetical protein
VNLLDLARMEEAVRLLHGCGEPLVWVMSPLMHEQLKGCFGPLQHDPHDFARLSLVMGHRVIVRKKADPRYFYLMREKDVPPEEA